MGAINFKGGFWTGGGSGRLFEYDTDECINCEMEYPCECGTMEFYDSLQAEIEYDEVESDLDNIKNRLMEKYGSAIGFLTETKGRLKYYTLDRLFKAVEMDEDFLLVNPGYYSGFQLIFNDRVNYYYNDGVEFCFDTLENTINDILATDEYVVWG